jgi:hypothetical protein
MAFTKYYNLPYPDPGQGEGWQELFEQAMQGLDSQMHENQTALDQAIGVRGIAESALTPYTMIGIGKMWPNAQPLFGPFTISKLVDEWFIGLKNFMGGQLSLPIRLPELAYCNPLPASSGASVAGIAGPVVQLKNDSNRTAIVNSPAYLSNEGGIVPSEIFTLQFPIIYPRTGNSVVLEDYTAQSYPTQKTNQDLVTPDTDTGDQFFTGGAATKAYKAGSYRGAFFNKTNFTAERKLTLKGLALGTFRVYGLSSAGVYMYEDVVFTGTGISEEHSTDSELWGTILGVSFKGEDLAQGTEEVSAKYCVVEVVLKSDGATSNITELRAFRYADRAYGVPGSVGDYGTAGDYPHDGYDLYVDYDRFVNPDPLFRISWESTDIGWLYDSSHAVAGLPFLMFGVGLRDNRIAFLKECLEKSTTSTGVDVVELVTELMTTGLHSIPSSPQPMYVVGLDKDGLSKIWPVYPKLVFTTANHKGYDGYWYDGGATEGENGPTNSPWQPTDDTAWPDTGVVPDPIHNNSDSGQYGTVLVYRYEFPTDLGNITQIFWANSDDILQYSKIFGLAVALPVGRVLAQTAAGLPTPVRLWTQNFMDNAAKFNVLLDYLIGYGTGNTTGQRVVQQINYITRSLGFSETDTHQLVNALPLLTGLLGFMPSLISEGKGVTIDFTINLTGSDDPTKSHRAVMTDFKNKSDLVATEMRIYFAIPNGEAGDYFPDYLIADPTDRWSHWYDEGWNRSFVTWEFADGLPVHNDFDFKGCGNVFIGILVMSDGSKYPVYPSNATAYAAASPLEFSNPLRPAYMADMDDIDDGEDHIITFAILEPFYCQYGNQVLLTTTRMDEYGLRARNMTPGEEYVISLSGSLASYGNIGVINLLKLRPGAPASIPLDSVAEFTPYVFPLEDGDHFRYSLMSEPDGGGSRLIDWEPIVTTPVAENSYLYDLIRLEETTASNVGEALNAYGTLLSLLYIMWLISPSAVVVVLSMSLFSLDQTVSGLLLAYLQSIGISSDPLTEIIARIRTLFTV